MSEVRAHIELVPTEPLPLEHRAREAARQLKAAPLDGDLHLRIHWELAEEIAATLLELLSERPVSVDREEPQA